MIHTTTAYSDAITNRVLSSYFDNLTASLNQHNLSPVMLQVDSGTNRSITNDIHILRDLKQIKPHYIGGIGSGITCTVFGNCYTTADNGTTIKVPMFYSSQSRESVISHQDIYDLHKYYSIFTKECDITTGKGTLTSQSKSSINKATTPLEENNRL